MSLKLITILSILANPFVPERLVTYNACCLAKNSCCADHSRQDKTERIVAHRKCCEPIVIVLRQGPPSPSTTAGIQPAARSLFGSLSASPPLAVVAETWPPARQPEWFAAGPPRFADVLALHTRLNL